MYVASEKWGRGLDLQLGYVFMLSPPANSASYLHLSGRTGRLGANGMAVTLMTNQQVPRLVAFAADLGISFEALDSSGSSSGEGLVDAGHRSLTKPMQTTHR